MATRKKTHQQILNKRKSKSIQPKRASERVREQHEHKKKLCLFNGFHKIHFPPNNLFLFSLFLCIAFPHFVCFAGVDACRQCCFTAYAFIHHLRRSQETYVSFWFLYIICVAIRHFVETYTYDVCVDIRRAVDQPIIPPHAGCAGN